MKDLEKYLKVGIFGVLFASLDLRKNVSFEISRKTNADTFTQSEVFWVIKKKSAD